MALSTAFLHIARRILFVASETFRRFLISGDISISRPSFAATTISAPGFEVANFPRAKSDDATFA